MTKRFYNEAAVIPLEDGGFGVALDGRPVRTPGRAVLAAPTAALAEAIAAEWAAQGERVQPLSMPMMRLAATAIDRIARERDAIVAQVAAYGGSDLLCYRAEGPDRLVKRQDAVWQPLLDWATEAHNARLTVTSGISHVQQSEAALAALHGAVDALDDWRLAAISQLTASCGSLVIALGVAARHIGAEQAVDASQLDEDFQAEEWGREKEAEDRRRALAGEVTDAARFLDLLTD